MEQTQEQNKSLAQQLVDEYYNNYEQTKPSEAELPNILSIIEFMLDKYHLGISIEPLKMTTERIKEIQRATPYPDSVSVQQALLQVWNEVAQESNQVQAVVKPEIAKGKRRFTEEEEKFIWWGIQWAYRPENINRTFNRDEFFAYIYSEMDV